VVTLGQQALQTVLLIAAPMMVSGLVVGLLVSVFQAATQINEQTMTFAPKIVAVLLALVVSAPWIINVMLSFTENIYQALSASGAGG
jgi:flagellar biosynthetic protein FliQ